MRIDHIGYAVRKMDRARTSMEQLGWTFEPSIEDVDRNVLLAFGELDGQRVELVAPLDRSKPSPVDEIVTKSGATPYHICYQSDDLESDIALLKLKHFKVTRPPAPAVAFGGKRVVFMYALSVGLIEIVEGG